MNMLSSSLKKLSAFKKWFWGSSLLVKGIALAMIVLLGWLAVSKIRGSGTQQVQYQTAQVEKATIVVSVTASGTVSTANSAQVTTKASGVVKKIYVQNEDKVSAGDPIAELELDQEGQQRMTSAWASYQSAKDQLYSLQSQMLTKWKTYMDIAQSGTYQNTDNTPKTDTRQLPQFVSTYDDWLSTEAAYKNQQNQITQTWLSYQQSSPVIYAPISGTVTGLGLQVGSVITAQSNSSGGSTAQKIASVKTEATPTVTVNLTEVDVPKIKVGNSATLTLDAFPGKTFTGKVISVDTVGSVTSGVTTYPAVIKLDVMNSAILTNMSAQANIITNTKSDVLMIPAGAVTTSNGQSTASVMKNGKPQAVSVETGLSSTAEIEITSGLNEGDTVVTGSTTTSSQQRTSSSSPFGGGGGFGGAGRIVGR